MSKQFYQDVKFKPETLAHIDEAAWEARKEHVEDIRKRIRTAAGRFK